MRRVFALLQAVWLALLIAEPASLHACDMHASGHASHAALAPTTVDDDSAHAHAHHENGPTETDDAEPSPCQCLGNCCAAATASLTAGPEIPAVALIAAAPASRDVETNRCARAPDLQLPFANGPPATLTT